MPNILRFAVLYDPIFYRSVIFRQFYRNKFVKIVSFGGFISFLLCIAYLFSYNPLRFSVFPFFALLYGIVTILIPILLWWQTHKSFKNSWIFSEKINFELHEKGITIRAESLQRELAWKEIVQAMNLQGNWVLYTNKVSFFYIPRQQLDADLAKEVDVLIRSKIDVIL